MKESKNSNQNNKEKKLDREFGLTSLSLNNRTSVIFLTILVSAMGFVTYINLPKDSYPEIEQPIVYVGTSYPGNSPVEMENLVTRELEKELKDISEITLLKSTSVQDYATIIAEFDPSMDVEDALRKVKDAVDRAKPELPEDLPRDPNVFEINFSDFPIMNINLSGDYALSELKRYAEYLEDEIEKLSEISEVNIRGVEDKEVKIKVDPYLMEARNVNFGDIENAIRAENVTLSGGNILNNGVRRTVRVIGEFAEPKQLEEIIVKRDKGNIVYLRDIAKIRFDYKERKSYARLHQQPVVMVDVVKRGGENLLSATEKIATIIERVKSDFFPEDVNVVITNDQSSSIREMVSSLENNIISGVIVVVFVLLLFLGTRNALFVGMAIPMSMFISFLILGALGITINMMVLFALIMALGMLVDNGIVVVENIYRLREEGYNLLMAAKLGVGEVAWPIISSTATTLAAFLPLAMWPGMIGEFMKYLPITLIIALGSSLFVALVINPVFISLFMKLDGEIKIRKLRIWKMVVVCLILGVLFILIDFISLGNILVIFAGLMLLNVYILMPVSKTFQRFVLPSLENSYKEIIIKSLRGRTPIWIFTSTVFALFLSFVLMVVATPKVLFFPVSEPGYINLEVEFPVGTDVQETNTFSKELEERTLDLIKPYKHIVKSMVTSVGTGGESGSSSSEHKARITINFVDFKYREGISTNDILDEMRDGVQGYVGVSVTVEKPSNGPPSGKPISIEITGDDFDKLLDVAEQMRNYINESGIGGIEKLKFDIETGKPEYIVNIDREKARQYGLSTYSVANELRTSLFGKEISKFKEDEEDYDIQLRLEDKYRYDMEVLMNKNITFRNTNDGKMHQVPISSVAKAEFSSGLGSVKRKDLKRVITLESNVLGEYNPTSVNNQIRALLEGFDLPQGYSFRFGGEQEKQSEEMSFLSRALLLAVFIIFLIIVAQFNKVTVPIIIMSSVLFSTIGVILGLIIFRMDFIIIMTMVGIISLAGVVVNNSIVLIDFIELKQRRLKEKLGLDSLSITQVVDMIVEAGQTRLRPVLLTAITTVLGLMPLAVGINIDFLKFLDRYDADFYLGGDNVTFWGPLSWTVIFGLVFATFLTLVVVPVMYLLIEKLTRRVRGN